MVSPYFLTRSVNLLLADGRRLDTGLREPRIGRSTVVLARGLCVFGAFAPAAPLGSAAGLRAARLFAAASRPFASAEWLIVRDRRTYGVWWWRRDRVQTLLAAAGLPPGSRLLPEPLAQPPGDGWRIVRGADGYDAQHWRGGLLVASAWRAAPFDRAAWIASIRGAGGDEGAPADPPATVAPAATLASGYRRRIAPGAPSTPIADGVLAWATAVTVFALADWSLQAARLDRLADAAELRATAAETAAGAFRAEVARARRLAFLKSNLQGRDPVSAVAEADGLLARHGVRIKDFAADRHKLVLALPGDAADGLESIVADFQASPQFGEVTPRHDPQSGELVLEIAVKAPAVALKPPGRSGSQPVPAGA